MKLKTTVLALLLAGASFAQIQFPQVSSKAKVDPANEIKDKLKESDTNE